MAKKKKMKTATTITHNTFTGIKWDGKAIEAVNNVAKGLLNLTELFKSQNIKIDTMLKIDNKNK